MRTVFLNLLPPSCHAILSISDVRDLTKLASMADVIIESSGNSSSSSIAADSCSEVSLESLRKDIDKLAAEFRKYTSFERNRGRSKPRNRS